MSKGKVLYGKSLIISVLSTFCLIFTFYTSLAQLVDNGQNPPGLKWKKIETPHFNILFPEAISADAMRMANTLEYYQQFESAQLQGKPGKTPVILQNQTVISNGFVTLGPHRAELYMTAPQDNGPVDWSTRLSIHEMRHVAQMNHVIQTKKIAIPLIQEFQFAMFGASLPIWFIEGDAVITETTLTPGGRGRLPGWEKEFRANLLSGKNYSYSKYFFGSLKDNVPDYYRMGYFMTSWLRRNYSDSVFTQILKSAARRSPLPGAFSSSVNKYVGKRNSALFDTTAADLRKHWKSQLRNLDPVNYPSLNRRDNAVPTDFLHPHFVDDNTIITLRQGYGTPPAFVTIDSTGKETKLLSIGPQLEPWFDYADGKIVWDEVKYDPRYQYRDYSIINIYDLATGKRRQLTKRSRLFAPSLSADGKKVVAVKTGQDNQNKLVMLNAATGEQLWESQLFTRQLHYPALDSAGERIVFMLTGSAGRSMAIYELGTGTFREIGATNHFHSIMPQFAGEQIIFQSHFNGINNIYAIDSSGGEIRQLTSARYGATHPHYSARQRQLLFNNFVPEGLNIAHISLDSLQNIPRMAIENTFRIYPFSPERPRPDTVFTAAIPARQYPVSDYKGLGRLFNFHSISPTASADKDNYTLGLRLKSNNLLNTLAFSTGYNYNLSVKSGEYTAGIEYRKFYPVLSADYINRKREAVAGSGPAANTFSWREHEIEFSAAVPLSFTHSNYLYAVRLSSGSSYTSRYAPQNAPRGFIQEIRFPWINRFSFIRQQRRSRRDLAPRFGQHISLLQRSMPFDAQLDGNLFAFESMLYFPGIFKHHSFSASFNFQHGSGIYRRVNEIPEISGASSLTRTEPLENTLLVDYRFPVAYPDWELGSFAYIKRIKAGLFVDYENVNRLDAPDSYGFELRADANFLRLYMPEFDIGTKVVFFRNKQIKSPAFELILNYNLAL